MRLKDEKFYKTVRDFLDIYLIKHRGYRYHSQPIKTGRYGILGEYLWHRNPIAW